MRSKRLSILKRNMQSNLRKMKLTNSILRDYNIDNSPKNYLKIEFYRIKLGKKIISRNIRSIENTKKIKKPNY